MNKLYHKTTLTWIRQLTKNRYQLGLTRRGIENIGSVQNIQKQDLETSVNKSTPLLTFSWQGYKTTSADELYHAVWDSVEGETDLISPVSGKIIQYNSKEINNPQVEDWLVEIKTPKEKELNTSIFVDEKEYIKYEETLDRGSFHERSD